MATVPRRRAAVLLLTVLLGFCGLGLRLSYVQGLHADDYSDLAQRQRVRNLDLPAIRGAIYDRGGQELALSVPARTVYANPKQISDAPATAAALAPILDAPEPEILNKLQQPRGFVYLARRLELERARQVESLRLPGIGTLNESRRVYPGGTLAANLTGFVGTDAEGLAGLEAAYESLLRGRPGSRLIEQDPHGRPIPQGVSREDPPVPGSDLVLTIDRDIQFAAEQALRRAVETHGGQGGTVVVMHVVTGDILAMANAPTFDPNQVGTFSMDDTRNRAVTDAYEPGSVNKVVTAAAALEEGLVTPDSPFQVASTMQVGGRQFKDAHPHPTETMSFEQILARSSNVGTIQVALQLGPDRLTQYMARFGYGRSTSLGFPGETSGILPRADRWATSLPTMAIGQGVSTSPLQLAKVYATIGNAGVAVEPRLVAGWVDHSGIYHAAPSSRPTRVVSAETAMNVQAMLTTAVESGTGTAAQIPGYSVAGKTGTAQKPGPRGGYQGYMASFVGLVPAERPQVAIAVVLDEPRPYWGGVVAAPVFREVGQAAVRILRIPPTQPAGESVPGDPMLVRAEGPASG